MASIIRIVSLPSEIRDIKDVTVFIEDTMNIGSVAAVTISALKTPTNIPYRTARVEMAQWSTSTIGQAYKKELIQSAEGTDGLIIEKFYFIDTFGQVYTAPINFHFDNGKTMNHIKLVYTHPHTEPPAMDIGEGWNSLYIPMVFGKFKSDEVLKDLIQKNLLLGRVSRIDYMVTKTEKPVMTAYVHFESWYDTDAARLLRTKLDTEAQYKCTGFMQAGVLKPLDVTYNRHILFRINHKPIPHAETPLNIHQLAAFKVALEARVAQLEDENATALARIAEFEAKIPLPI